MASDSIQLFIKKSITLEYFFKKISTFIGSPEIQFIYLTNPPKIERPINSAIQAILLKKYYESLIRTGSNHWAIKANSKRIHSGHRQLHKKFITNFTHCFYCNKEMNTDPKSPLKKTIDHYIPLGKGGSGKRSNLRTACALCNLRKKDIHPELEPDKWNEFLSLIK